MKNIEKYKDRLKNMAVNDLSCCVCTLVRKGQCYEGCSTCKEKAIEWLCAEYEEQILDEVEKNYLAGIIKPFRKNVLYISKIEKGYEPDVCFIAIVLKGSERIHLPYFNTKTGMYAGMKTFSKYSLEELGL